jgi:hypothetical protein
MSSSTSPVARKIMIIRHGEKPRSPGAPFGVQEDGAPGASAGSNMLLVRGWMRAGGIAALFGRDPLGDPALARPAHLFTCKAEAEGSHRPHDTLVPLSRKIGVEIDDRYGQDEYEAMAEDAMTRQGVVLVCWEHKRIRRICKHLPRHGGPPNDFHWPGDRFDVIFVFDLDGGAYRFSQTPELLLDGDSPEPIDLTASAPAGADDDG